MNLPISKQMFKGHRLAARYMLYSLVLLLVIGFVVDRFVIPVMEDSGNIASTGWKTENDKILNFMYQRNDADCHSPVWRSRLFPVAIHKSKAKRILVMGDSYVWGHGYTNLNTIWWRQLQLELERRGYHNVEVIAAGMRGAPTWKEVEWAEKLVPRYKPDLLIWGYLANDTDEGERISLEGGKPLGAINVEETGRIERGLRKALKLTFPNLCDQLFAIRKKYRGDLLAGEQNGWQYGDLELKYLDGNNFEHYRETVKKLGHYSHSLNIPVFAITFPNAVTYACSTDDSKVRTGADFYENIRRYYMLRFAPVQSLFTAAQVPFYNTLDDFMNYAVAHTPPGLEKSKFAFQINPVNSHPGPMTTHFYAIKAADYIEANYRDTLGQRQFDCSTYSPTIHINDCVPPDIELQEKLHQVAFSFPQSDDELLSMPMRKPCVQLNFEHAVRLASLQLAGIDLRAATLYVSFEDKFKHYDDGTFVDLGTMVGPTSTWTVPDHLAETPVNSIRINAKFGQAARNLTLTFNPIP